MAPMDAIWLVLVRHSLCRQFVATRLPPTFSPYKGPPGIGYASKNTI